MKIACDSEGNAIALGVLPATLPLPDGRTLVVRLMEQADVAEVVSIEQHCFSSPWSARSFVSCVADRDVVLSVVGTVEEKIVGYAINWVVPPEIHIGNLAVAAAFRRLGIGRYLLQTVLAYGRRVGCLVAHLEVRVSNVAAITLYQQMGFRKVIVRRRYYEDNGEDALLMSLNIGL